MKTIGWITTTTVLIILAQLYSGFALSVLWQWFIVDLFDLPSLSIASAIGIMCIVSFLTMRINMKPDDTPWGERLRKGTAVAIAKPSYVLALGWCVSWFI